jgi:ribosome-binding factor A
MSRHQGKSANRGQRVAQQLHHEVAEMIRSEVKDPRIGLVTVTDVDLTADYAYLTVYFSVLPDDEETVKTSLQGLQKAAGFIRSKIGRRVRIHTTPEIRFVHDRSTTDGMEMSLLIDKALADSPSPQDDDDHGESDATNG